MALIEFKNKPDLTTPITADALNHNFNESNDDIKIIEYTQSYSVTTGTGTYGRVTINASAPSGYTWVGYEIISNGYVNSIVNWIMSSTAAQCLVAWYNTSSETFDDLTMVIKGIYKKA